MRVFVYEYTCATGAAQALHAEGWAMLHAVMHDLASAGMRPVTLLADPFPHHTDFECKTVRGDEESAFRELAAAADQCLIIAPETGGILEQRCRWAEDAGGWLLGPGADLVARVADKKALGRHLADRGIPAPKLLGEIAGAEGISQDLRAVDFPVIVKPRRGAGAQATFRAESGPDLADCVRMAQALMAGDDLVIQKFVPGRAASVAFLAGPRGLMPLRAGLQNLSARGRLTYQGGSLPLPAPLAERAVSLGLRTLETIPRLRGYIGIDLVLGDAADGSDDVVIEINPRLTTPYIGLRRLARFNVAEVMVGVAQGQPIPRLHWRAGRVDFRTDGTVHESDGGGTG